MANFIPKYATPESIYARIKNISTRGATFRRDVDDILNCAIAHDFDCAKNGGSIGTVLSKAYGMMLGLGFIKLNGIKLKLRAVYGTELAWDNKNKTFGGKVSRNETFVNADKTVAYFDCPFWEMKASAGEKSWDWEGTLNTVFNGKTVNKKLADMTAKERERFQAYRELFGLIADKIMTPEMAVTYASELRDKVGGKAAQPEAKKRQRRNVIAQDGEHVALN